MGIKDLFLDFVGVSPNEHQSNDNQVSVPDEELDEYLNSKLGKCDMMLSELVLLNGIVPEESTSLTNKIIEFTERFDEDSLALETEFQQLQSRFEKVKLLAVQKSKIQELQIANNDMRKYFSTSSDFVQLPNEIKHYKELITIIKNSIDGNSFSSIDLKNRFIREYLISEYRLGMLQLLAQVVSDKNGNSSIHNNPFTDLHIAKQTLFSGLLCEDAKELLNNDFERIPQPDLINKFYPECPSDLLYKIHDDLVDLLPKAVLSDDFSLATLMDSKSTTFDSLDFLRKLVILRYHTNILINNSMDYILMNIHDREQAEINKPIEDKIQEISNDLLPGNKHIRIIDYQRSVARERGLLETEKKIQSQELSFIPVNALTLYQMIQKANNLGINYTVFPDVQEQQSSDNLPYLFVVSTVEEYKVLCDYPSSFQSYDRSKFPKYITLGIFPYPIIDIISKSVKNDSIRYEIYDKSQNTARLMYGYNPDHESTKFAITQIQYYKYNIEKALKDLQIVTPDTPETLKNIMCYLSVPTQTNIIPLLTEMQKSGVDAFMEPIVVHESERNQKSRDFIHIYFNRNDLEEVQTIVDTIKSRNQTPISINGIYINFDKKILEELEEYNFKNTKFDPTL